MIGGYCESCGRYWGDWQNSATFSGSSCDTGECMCSACEISEERCEFHNRVCPELIARAAIGQGVQVFMAGDGGAMVERTDNRLEAISTGQVFPPGLALTRGQCERCKGKGECELCQMRLEYLFDAGRECPPPWQVCAECLADFLCAQREIIIAGMTVRTKVWVLAAADGLWRQIEVIGR